MKVCDICKDGKLVKSYIFPMKQSYQTLLDGKYIDRYDKYEDREIDLCPTCQRNIADLIADMRYDYQQHE